MAERKPLAIGSAGVSVEFDSADTIPPGNVPKQMSITSDASGLKLSGDSASPGNSMLYGTNGSGTKGWYAQPGSPSVITPSSISSDQDNYAPTGWADATMVRINVDPSMPAITGFSAETSGEQKIIFNTSGSPFVITTEDTNSTAANRVAGDGDIILLPNEGGILAYDGTSSRWRFIQFGSGIGVNRKTFRYAWAPGTITGGDWGQFAIGGTGGTSTGAAATTGFPGSIELGTSTNSSGVSLIYFVKTMLQFAFFQEAHISYAVVVSVTNLSDGTNTYTISSIITGSPSSTSVTANDSVGIRYSSGINSGKFEGYSRNGAASETTVDLGITVSANTQYNLRTEINKSGTIARFYIDGNYCGEVAATMPTSVAAGVRTGIFKSAGITARVLRVHSMNATAVYP